MRRALRLNLLTAMLVGGLLMGSSVESQPMDLGTPPGSPAWWTLTEDISPSELRATLRDPQGHMERYQAALRAGLAQPLTDELAKALRFYYNRSLNPELTPMWLAFDAFAIGHLEVHGERYAADALADFGFDSAATAVILEFTRSQSEQSQELVQALAEKSMRFVDIQRKAIQARGGGRRAYEAVVHAAKHGDLDVLRGSTDISREELAELRAAWLRHPMTETAVKLLPELRSQLSDTDWKRFRRFLLEKVVTRMGAESKDFGYVEEVNQ